MKTKKGEKREERLTACSNKGESATCISAAHNAPLSSSRSVRASLPFSHSLPPRSPHNPLLSPLSCSLLDADSLRFVDVIHRGGYIWAECLVARCTERDLPPFLPDALCLPLGYATHSLLSTTCHLRESILHLFFFIRFGVVRIANVYTVRE